MNRDRDSKWDFKGNRPYYRPGELIPKKVWDSMDDVDKEYYQEEARKIHEEREIAREEFDKRLAEEKRKREERNKPLKKLLRIAPLYTIYWILPFFTCFNNGYFVEISCSSEYFVLTLFITPILVHIIWRVFHFVGMVLGLWDKDEGFFSVLTLVLFTLLAIYIYIVYIPKFNYWW